MSFISFFKTSKYTRIRAYSSFKIMKEEGLILQVVVGAPSIYDLKASRERLISHPDFNKSFSLCSDFRSCLLDFGALTVTDILDFFKRNPRYALTNPKHISIVSNRMQRIFLTIFSAFLKKEGREIGVFENFEDALKWYGRPDLSKYIEAEFAQMLKELKPIQSVEE